MALTLLTMMTIILMCMAEGRVPKTIIVERQEDSSSAELVKITDTISYRTYSVQEQLRREEEKLLNELESRGTIKYEYDKLKDDDYINEPYFYRENYELTDEERTLVEQIVMHESGWCPDYRICVLTAQCVRNDCEKFGLRPAEAFEKCGYARMSWANPRAVKAVYDVFDRGIKCVDEQIFCYYNCNMVESPYHESNNLAIDIEGNRFFY